MKAIDVINQLKAVLPTLTTKFSSQLSLVSITPSGTTATATTVDPHNLVTADSVNITDSFAPVAISAITRSGTVATATTATNHDITVNDSQPFHTEATISGANEAEFNGTFPLLSSPNRKTFTFAVDDSGPVSGSGSMLLVDPPSAFGYNGVHVITVAGSTTFTYTLPATLTEAAIGGTVNAGMRITGGINPDRIREMYTKQSIDDLWAFVSLGDTVASKDRDGRNDAITSVMPGQSLRQQIYQELSVIIYAPTVDDLSGREARDDIESIRPFLFKSLLGVQFDNSVDKPAKYGLSYAGDGAEEYTTAFYAHVFNFQLLEDITNEDTVAEPFSVAFRDIDMTMTTSLGNEPLTATIDLDDEPL